MRGVARTAVVAGTATAVAGRVSRRQNNRWAAQDQQGQAQDPAYQQQAPPQQQYAAPPPQPEPAPAGPDYITQLKELADLHSQGALTDEEFAAQKTKILSSS